MIIDQRMRIYPDEKMSEDLTEKLDITCPDYMPNQRDQLNNCGIRSAQWLVRNSYVSLAGDENFGTVQPEGEPALEFLTPIDSREEPRLAPDKDFDCRNCGKCVRLEFSPFGTETYLLVEPEPGT